MGDQKVIPFTQEITKLIGADLIDSLKKCNKKELISNLLWISKFAFDKDYLSFKSITKKSSITSPVSKNVELSNFVLKKYSKYFKLGNGYQEFQCKYPVLKGLQKHYVRQVGEYMNSICQNFEQNKESISKTIFNNVQLGSIDRIDVGQGDVHQNGKSTAIVYLNDGNKIVYKPRSGELDLAYNSFLEGLNSRLSNVDLKTVKIYNGGDYFWMEYIEHLPCSSVNDLESYYFHSGVLLAVVYLLRGMDFHHENIIANGKNPVIIDTECLFSFNKGKGFSLIQTCLLPFFSSSDTCQIDHSGLGAIGEQKSESPIWAWTNIDSDECELNKVKGRIIAKNNQPKLNSHRTPPTEYLDQILDGFSTICNFVIESKDSFNKENPFEVFKDKQVRILVRTTQSYASILENSYLPSALGSEESRRSCIVKGLIEFPILFSLNQKQREVLYGYEYEAIHRMDIPFFTANTSKKYLLESDQLVFNDYYNLTPFDFVMNQIKSFNQIQLNSEIEFIKSAFAARYDMEPIRSKSEVFKEVDCNTEINKITKRILDCSLDLNGNLHWNSFVSSINNKVSYDNIGFDLYSGNLGIALFLSSVSEYKGNDENLDVIETIIEQCLSDFTKSIQNENKINLSIESGISGLLYCLNKINYSKYRNEILKLSSLITDKVIEEELNLDLISGLSGCLVIMVDLYKENESDLILNKIKQIANHLLSKRKVDTSTKKMVWSTLNEKTLTGLAHGNSGVAYAILKAFEVTNDKLYRKSFYEVVDFEDFYFDIEENNWRDLRFLENTFQNMWCHGAPGIGLNRLYGYQILGDSNLLKGVERAIKYVESTPISEIDFYCCGNFGRFDFLLEAAKVLENENLYNTTREKINSLILLRNSEGYYRTHSNYHIGVENPSLFKGLSGIGYILLRTINPIKFPSLGLFK